MVPTRYRLSMPAPHTQLLDVEIRVEEAGESLELVMPSWAPGSYLMREFPRNVQDFEARSASGDPLPWRRTDKSTWRVDARGAGAVVARYRVLAAELSVRTSHLDDTHAFVNGTSVFALVRGREGAPVELEVEAPAGWEIATALEATGGGRFVAPDYDVLVDSPLEIGAHREVAWEHAGVPHRYVFWGEAAVDDARLVADTDRIVAVTAALFGGLPYPSYLFITHVLPEGRGGLEHADSCALQVSRGSFSGEGYESFLALVAHEFFHVWNAKRIRPETLGPFDYTRENYTRNLFVVEGLTTYYTDLILRRAGLIDEPRYLERLAESISRFRALPGRRRQSLADSSFDAWIRFYRPDAHTPNAQVSYYHKGALVGLLLDMEIRRVTAGERSLDDLMRLLWERYGARDVGFPEEIDAGIRALAEEVAGVDLEAFFRDYVHGVAELDFDRALDVVGLRLGSEEPAKRGEGPAAAAATPSRIADLAVQESRLGVRTREQEGRLRVTNVLEGSPAWDAGLNAGDEIAALDGVRVAGAELPARLRALPEGEVEVAVFRREALRTFRVPLGPDPAPKARLEPVPEPAPEQEAARRDWLREEPVARA